MAYVPGREWDVFVSYAHVNNKPYHIYGGPDANQAEGWVTRLVNDLKQNVSEHIGKEHILKVWRDDSALRGNHPVTKEIAAQIKNSALFLAIRSTGYLVSQWCQDEVRLFTQHCGENLANRLFVVEKSPPDTDLPSIPELTGRKDYPFWYRERDGKAQLLELPMSHKDEVAYVNCWRALGLDIFEQLKSMGGRLHHSGEIPPGPLTGALSAGALAVPPAQATKELPVVFVNAEAHHHDIADKIREGIGARAIWIDAILKGSAGEVREGFAQTFGGCDAMVTVYVDNDAWARSQLLEARRLTATYPGRKIPVIDAPPKDKPPLGLHNMPNMEIIDARSGIGPDVLSRLQTCLGL